MFWGQEVIKKKGGFKRTFVLNCAKSFVVPLVCPKCSTRSGGAGLKPKVGLKVKCKTFHTEILRGRERETSLYRRLCFLFLIPLFFMRSCFGFSPNCQFGAFDPENEIRFSARCSCGMQGLSSFCGIHLISFI